MEGAGGVYPLPMLGCSPKQVLSLTNKCYFFEGQFQL
jgi:hypothetical protein